MNTLLLAGIGALIVINIIVLALYGVDKWKAKNDRWRISENTLILAGLIAPVGAIIGMNAFHHKTRKPKFKLNYLFLVLHIVLLYVLWSQGVLDQFL